MLQVNLLQIVDLHCLDIHEYNVLGEILGNVDIDIMGSFVLMSCASTSATSIRCMISTGCRRERRSLTRIFSRFGYVDIW